MNQILRASCLTVLLSGFVSALHGQYSSPPVGNTVIGTSPGTIRGTQPSQTPIVVTNATSDILTNTSRIGTTPGGIRGGTIPSQSPTPVTNVAAGADLTRPAPAISQKIPKGDIAIELQLLADGLIAPLGISAPDDNSGRLFVYDQAGLVWSIDQTTGATNVLLDVRDRLVPLMPGYDERGLLGFTVHTNFAQNPLVYTFTSEPVTGAADFTLPRPADAQFDHQNVIAEWRLDPANSNRVDVSSRREILRIDQPQFNHNGGTLRFGPDGNLYFSLGDGGGADDQDGQPFLGQLTWGHGSIGNGQNIETLHGSILRIDVAWTNAVNGRYVVPADNPFVGTAGLDEIYAYGFRNPYSFSFDRLTGYLYAADAGEKSIEEIDRVVKGGNYGWNFKEGSFFFEPNGVGIGYITNVTARAFPTNLVNPIAEFDHDEGRVVIGGFVYRGTNVPSLAGQYLASIFALENEPYSRIVYMNPADTNATSQNALREIRIGLEDRRPDVLVRGFGEDAQGELYVLGSTEIGPMGRSGKVYRVVPPPPVIVVTNNTRAMATNDGITVTNITLGWQGGMGPFGVEQKINLGDFLWNVPLYTTNRAATIPGDGPGSVVRVTEKPHVVTSAFSAVLAPVPGVTNRIGPVGSGLGLFVLEGNELSYLVLYSNLTATATVANIHGPAAPGEEGPSIIGLHALGAMDTSGVLAGTAVLDDAQRLVLLNGEAYLRLSSADYPEGEVRGTVVAASLMSQLRGAHERPIPVNTPALGSALMALVGNRLSVVLNFHDLSSPAIAAHIHGPAGHDDAAPPIVDLTPYLLNFGTNGTVAGTVTLTNLSHLDAVAAGRTYLNVHSQVHTNGEIRGQIYLAPGATPLTVHFTGAAERPAVVNTPAAGWGLLAVANNHMAMELAYTNLSSAATAAHIHGPAGVEQVAPPAVPLTPLTVATSTNSGFISGQLDLSPSVLTDILNGLSYANVHTTNHPDGEIRSQIAPVLTRASLSGMAERPPVTTPGLGLGVMVLVGNQLDVHLGFGNLTGPANAAHIHGPATFETVAGIVTPLTPVPLAPNGSVVQSIPLTLEQWNLVISGLTYLNVHTTTYPDGEIRGQVLP